MYELAVERLTRASQLEWDNILEQFKNIVKTAKFVTVKNVIDHFSPHTIYPENAEKLGWHLEDMEGDWPMFQEMIDRPGTVIMILPDPKNLEEWKNEFDSVHRPAHYAEGRKYEPRKVIADWGLNFNLGNAVKYVARAGRKGDKIEDLRKAIQYIEFEIEELGGILK